MVLIGTGSEVQLAVAGARAARREGRPGPRRLDAVPRVVRRPGPVLPRDACIPPTVKARVSVEAGVAQGWREIVGDHGRIVSLEHYGASADFARIYREFGITAQAVADAAEDSIRVATG